MTRDDLAELAMKEMQGCEEYQQEAYSLFPYSITREECLRIQEELWKEEHSDFFCNQE